MKQQFLNLGGLKDVNRKYNITTDALSYAVGYNYI